jgi:hypothetical protein
VALVLASLLAPLDAVWRVVLFVLAAIAFFTVGTRYSPVNSLIGVNT